MKYSDGGTSLSLLTDPTLYQRNVDWIIDWCDINTKKTEEIIFGLPPDCQLPSVMSHNEEIKQVSSYK